MKKSFFILFAGIFIVSISATRIFTNSGGALKGYSGAPSDQNCTACHGGTALTSGVFITIMDDSGKIAAGYKSGKSYTINVSGTKLGVTKFGFELTAFAGTQHAGTISIIDPNTALCQGTQDYITHKAGGNAGNNGTATWAVSWNAPSSNMGEVKFYAAVNATNNNGGADPGDAIMLGSASLSFETTGVTESMPQNTFVRIYPNPVTENIHVTASPMFGKGEIRIFDISGKIVLRSQKSEGETTSLNVTSLSSGNYLLEIKNEKYRGASSFMKN